MSTIEFNKDFQSLTSSLMSFAYNLTRNDNDAKDLYQDTAFRALKNKEKFRPGTNFKAWLFTIMKNIFINDYRKKVKRNTVIDTTDNMYYINSGGATIRNKASQNIMMKELEGMVESLADNIKTPFLMHYIGYKYQEISDKLKLPLGTIKSRIFFARQELKQKVNRQYGDLFKALEKA